jgi:hypothetical protein
MTQPSSLDIVEYIRKPFTVKAVEVTAENMEEVAKWCRGTIRTEPSSENGQGEGQKYIKVEVKRAISERQTRAMVGDMVLRAGSGFKVYTPKAFAQSFDRKVKDMMAVVENMVKREHAEEKAEREAETVNDTVLPTSGHDHSFISR